MRVSVKGLSGGGGAMAEPALQAVRAEEGAARRHLGPLRLRAHQLEMVNPGVGTHGLEEPFLGKG